LFLFPFLFSTLTFVFSLSVQFVDEIRLVLAAGLRFFPQFSFILLLFFFFFLQCARWWTRSAVLKRTLHSDFDVANVLGR
jgi:hypothetical protein